MLMKRAQHKTITCWTQYNCCCTSYDSLHLKACLPWLVAQHAAARQELPCRAVCSRTSAKASGMLNRLHDCMHGRLLELTGAKDPKALEGLVAAMGISQESVNRDLMTYKARSPLLAGMPCALPCRTLWSVCL